MELIIIKSYINEVTHIIRTKDICLLVNGTIKVNEQQFNIHHHQDSISRVISLILESQVFRHFELSCSIIFIIIFLQ